jgi:hypothetical protein
MDSSATVMDMEGTAVVFITFLNSLGRVGQLRWEEL